jgi:phosphatidate phosphatase APP1
MAWRDPETGRWNAIVHGWIYEPEHNSSRRLALLAMLRRSAGLQDGEDSSELFKLRAWPFFADNERGKQVVVRIVDRVHRLPPSEANGHFDDTLALTIDVASESNAAKWLEIELAMPASDQRRFTGRLYFIEPEGLSVVSDIDDTIKISEVHSQAALLRNTFLREFEAVPGMAELYRRLAARGAAFHYVSASPWQLYAHLQPFLEGQGFPAGTYHLQPFRWTDETVFEMVRSPLHNKLARIRIILDRYPRRRFVLIGDSAQEDPEIYATLARERPGQIARILIRNVTNEEPGGPRCQAAFAGVPADIWQLFTDPQEVRLPE